MEGERKRSEIELEDLVAERLEGREIESEDILGERERVEFGVERDIDTEMCVYVCRYRERGL